jgi:hypothetical protein
MKPAGVSGTGKSSSTESPGRPDEQAALFILGNQVLRR